MPTNKELSASIIRPIIALIVGTAGFTYSLCEHKKDPITPIRPISVIQEDRDRDGLVDIVLNYNHEQEITLYGREDEEDGFYYSVLGD